MRKNNKSSLWQTMLALCIFLVCPLPAFSGATATNVTNVMPSFSSAEHILSGDNILLFFSNNDPGQQNYHFLFPNGLSLTYGELLALGDFYLIPGQPIARGATPLERKTRFLEAFNSLTQNPGATGEAKQILDVLHAEKKLLVDGMRNGQTPAEVYEKIGSEFDRQLNCITGGGCDPGSWWLYKGRYLIILEENYDHFGNDALLAYEAGHQAAMEQALVASETRDTQKLELAYAMDAFASHFLSDRFSSGHIRTPRNELPQEVTPDFIGNLLVLFMHDEESQFGLRVHNRRGDRWYAYGDKYYFHPNGAQHRQLLTETLQVSLNHIFAVYQQGSMQISNPVPALIPQPDEVKNAANLDISPLFYWDDYTHTLMRRNITANPYDRHWTADWWGWSTLAQLQREKGLSFLAQARLAQSEFAEKALRQGLITDKQLVQYVKMRQAMKGFSSLTSMRE